MRWRTRAATTFTLRPVRTTRPASPAWSSAIQSVAVSEDGTQVEILLTDPVALENILKYKERALTAVLERTK